MAHLVRFRTPDGEVVTEEVADLDAAVGRVEVLRNEGVVDDVRVWAEVPLRFETVVRVSVAGAEPPAPAPTAPTTTPAPETTPAPATTPATAPARDEAPPAPAAPVEPPPGAMLSPVRVEAPSADADDLVEAPVGEGKRGLFNRG